MSGTRARPGPAATAGPAAGPATQTQRAHKAMEPPAASLSKPYSHRAKGSWTKGRH